MIQWYKHFILGRMSSRWTNQPFEGPDVATPWGPNHYCHVTRHTVLRVWNRGYQSPFGPDRLERILIDFACLAYSHIVSIVWLLKVTLTSFNKSANLESSQKQKTPDCDSMWFQYQKHTIGLPARPAGGWKNLPGFDPHHYTPQKTGKKPSETTLPPCLPCQSVKDSHQSDMLKRYRTHVKESFHTLHTRHLPLAMSWYFGRCFQNSGSPGRMQTLPIPAPMCWIPKVSVLACLKGCRKGGKMKKNDMEWNRINSNDAILNGRFIHQHRGHSSLTLPHTWSPSKKKHCKMM